MIDHSDISDETLTAFLDDELSAEDRAMIAKALESDSGLEARLMALDVSTVAIRESADAVLRHAPPMRALPPNSEAISLWPKAAGLAAACAVGVVIGFGWNSTDDQDWVAAVANYQSLYVTETLKRSESLDQRASTLASLSKAIDLDLAPLLDIADIEYRRAQLLGFDGKPLVQVAYLDNDVPIAICVTFQDGDDSPLRQGAHFGLASASWQKDGRGFLVIGGKDTALIRRIADQVLQSL